MKNINQFITAAFRIANPKLFEKHQVKNIKIYNNLVNQESEPETSFNISSKLRG